MPKLDRKRGLKVVGTLETAAVVTSVAQGEVLAMVGGRDPGYAGFNRALDAVRSIGSLIKPVIYLTALAQPERYSLVTPIADKPVGICAPAASSGAEELRSQHPRQVPLYRALAKSYNLATVNLGLQLGVDEVAEMLQGSAPCATSTRCRRCCWARSRCRRSRSRRSIRPSPAGGFRAPLRTIREVLDASGGR
jgi:penicillin-binding protein 1B